mgnify:CR=1 FL=1
MFLRSKVLGDTVSTGNGQRLSISVPNGSEPIANGSSAQTEKVTLYNEQIPDIVIGRLPVYLRTLELLAHEGNDVTSSQELGRRLGISSAQSRKDLRHFGEFGKQGTGYSISFLCNQLSKILQVDRIWPIVLVGAGYLGHALSLIHI